MLFLGTTEFCFLPLLVTLVLAGGHMISRKQNFLPSFSHRFSVDEIQYGFETIQVEYPDTAFEWDLKNQGE